jgi:polyferredoxin
LARKAKYTWSTARKICQGVFLLFWLVLFTAAAGLTWPADLVHLPVQLDPLLMIMQTIAARALVGGALLSLIVLLLSLVFGRVWCGWICPLGTVLDLFPFKSRKKKLLSEGLRVGKYLLLAAILIAALFGNLTLLIFDPITLWIRTLTGSVWPGLNTAFTAVEYVLVRIPFLSDPITWLDQVFRPAVFPASPVGIRQTWLPLAIFTAIILLNLLAERFWCRYLCPLGGLLGLLARFAPFKRTVGRECKSCGHCTSACPTGTIDPARGYASDPAECTLCMDCLPACPTGKIGFTREAIHPQSMPYDPDRRAVLAAGLVTAAGLAVVQTDSDLRSAPPNLLRPPGTRNEDLLRKCLRCGLCMRACPTGALQPS